MGQEAQRGTAQVLQIGNWRQQRCTCDLRIELRPLREQHQQHSRALRVAHIVQPWLLCNAQHVLHHGGHVVDADLVPAELPEGRLAGSQPAMVSRRGGATRIGQPHVVAVRVQSEGKCTRSSTCRHIVRSRADQAVHQHERQQHGAALVTRWRDTLQSQLVTVRGLHVMHLTLDAFALHKVANGVARDGAKHAQQAKRK